MISEKESKEEALTPEDIRYHIDYLKEKMELYDLRFSKKIELKLANDEQIETFAKRMKNLMEEIASIEQNFDKGESNISFKFAYQLLDQLSRV